MDFSRHNELLEGIVNMLIDEETLGVCFEMHRAIKLGYYELLYPDDSVYEKQPIIDVKGLDIFGNVPQSQKKAVDCVCPNCSRTLGAQKFAPHLEKCMGMGRNSSRLATKKQKTPIDSEQEPSDDNEDEWTYPERRRETEDSRWTALVWSNMPVGRKARKEKMVTNSPGRKVGRGPGRPPKHSRDRVVDRVVEHEGGSSSGDIMTLKPSLQQHNTASFSTLPSEHKHKLLQQICGVVSGRTGRLCTRSVNCPQHTEDQRKDVRRQLMGDLDFSTPPSSKRAKEKSSPDISDELDVEGHYNPSHTHSSSSESPLITSRKKKSKRSKKGHGSSSYHHSSSRQLY